MFHYWEVGDKYSFIQKTRVFTIIIVRANYPVIDSKQQKNIFGQNETKEKPKRANTKKIFYEGSIFK